MEVVIPKGAVLGWQFPKKEEGVTSNIVTGKKVVYHIDGHQPIMLHFKGTSLEKIRSTKRWSLARPVHVSVRRGSIAPDVVLRPCKSSTPATHFGFCLNAKGSVELLPTPASN